MKTNQNKLNYKPPFLIEFAMYFTILGYITAVGLGIIALLL